MFTLNGNQNKILKMLKSCGLNEYQSKAYFTLLISGKSKAWDLYKRSSVPQSKIYYVVEELKEKGLVKVEGWKPKIIIPKNFLSYISKTVESKKKEIETIEKTVREVYEITSTLKPIAMKYRRYRVFEPKYRR